MDKQQIPASLSLTLRTRGNRVTSERVVALGGPSKGEKRAVGLQAPAVRRRFE